MDHPQRHEPSDRVCPVCLSTDHSPALDRCPDDGATLLALDAPTVAHDGPALGTLFAERFVLLGVLGVGGSGTVYRAFQRPLGREVALKVLAIPSELAIPGSREWAELGARFRREAALLAQLRSPHVVDVFDAGETVDGISWLAMERADGEPLDQVLQAAPGGRLPPARVLAIARALAAALRDIHSHGIVHRDVKPANILVGASGAGAAHGKALKLVDFGIARALADASAGSARLTRTGIVLGSLAYMAPEQLSTTAAVSGAGRALVGPATDVYAAGVTLFELLTGEHPYPGPSAPAYALQHREAPIPHPKTGDAEERTALGRALAAVITRCLAKDPAARPADGEALLELLEQATDPAVLAARASDVRARLVAEDEARARPAARRFRPGRVLRLVAAGLALAVFVWGLVEGR